MTLLNETLFLHLLKYVRKIKNFPGGYNQAHKDISHWLEFNLTSVEILCRPFFNSITAWGIKIIRAVTEKDIENFPRLRSSHQIILGLTLH